jgi:uncharacterized protein (TIGR02246 family)
MIAIANSTTPEEQVRTTLDDMLKALRAKDAKRVLSFYAPEPVLFELAPPLQQSGNGASGEKALGEWFASFNGPVGYETRDLKVTVDGTLAVCHGLGHLTGARTDGTQTDTWTRLTRCLRKIDGQWRITHSHESVPFYMDGSNKAALDLKP